LTFERDALPAWAATLRSSEPGRRSVVGVVDAFVFVGEMPITLAMTG